MKRGSSDALALLGYGRPPAVEIERVRIVPRRVTIGSRVSIGFVLRSRSREAQDLLVDLAVHFVKASGRATPKVFKVTRVLLAARGRAELATTVSLAVHTTRTPRPGRHVVEVVINGKATPLGAFHVAAVKS